MTEDEKRKRASQLVELRAHFEEKTGKPLFQKTASENEGEKAEVDYTKDPLFKDLRNLVPPSLIVHSLV